MKRSVDSVAVTVRIKILRAHANKVREACELIEAAFEYVTGDYNDGGKNLPQTQIARQYVHTLKTMLES